MAQILRGKHRNEVHEVKQWCNNWIMLDNGDILNPVSVRLNQQEIERFRESFDDGRAGMMPGLYDLTLDGFFKKRKKV